jgi:hypothetical protein
MEIWFHLSRDFAILYINMINNIYCRGGQEISVVYFRAGYAPTDYPSEAVSVYSFSWILLLLAILFQLCSKSIFFWIFPVTYYF